MVDYDIYDCVVNKKIKFVEKIYAKKLYDK